MTVSSWINNDNKSYDHNVDVLDLDDPAFSIDKEIEVAEGYRPVKHYMMVKVYAAPVQEMTKGGIIIPGSMQNDAALDRATISRTGLVVKFAKGVYEDEARYPYGPLCKVGDFINYPRGCGHTIAYKGKKYILLGEDSLIGVVDDPRNIQIV